MSPILKTAVPLFLISVSFLAVAGEVVGIGVPTVDLSIADQQAVAAWAVSAAPNIVSLLGAGGSARERKGDMALIKHGATLQLPNWVEWSGASYKPPEVAFKVDGEAGLIQAEHLYFTHAWVVHVPGVLTESNDKSSYQVAVTLDITVIETRSRPLAFVVSQLHAHTV